MSLLLAHVDCHLRGHINNISMLTGCKYLPMMFYGGHLHGAWKHNMLIGKYRSKREEVTQENGENCTISFIKFFSSMTVWVN